LQARHDLEVEKDRLSDALDWIRPRSAVDCSPCGDRGVLSWERG
jgi:hypothetical protein